MTAENSLIKVLFFTLLVFCSIFAIAQSPLKRNTQFIARLPDGNLVRDKFISVEISFIDSSSTPFIAYSEVDTATTNFYGLFTVHVGSGKIKAGTGIMDFDAFTGCLSMQIKIDPTGGNNFIPVQNLPLPAR